MRTVCLSFCVGQAFHNSGGRGVINNWADMWSGWGFAVSEWACLNQCTALWYQSSGGREGMQPLFLQNQNASGNVLYCSSNRGSFCDWTLVIKTFCWQAALFHSIRFSTSSSTQLTIKSSMAFCTKLGHPTHCHGFLFMVKGINFSLRASLLY